LYLEVYPDIIFILNFFIDFILLFLLKKVNRKSSKLLRLIAAAAIGGAASVVVGIYPWMNVVIRILILNVAASILMVFIAFGRLKPADLLKQVIVFYLITYFAGGFMNSVYYYTDIRLILVNLGKGLSFSNISWKFVVIILLIMIPTILLSIRMFRWYRNNSPQTFEVELVLNDRRISTKGLVDTGNCLFDPIYKRPVMVVENLLMDELLSEEFRRELKEAKNYVQGNNFDTVNLNMENEHLLRLRFIPYQSIGKKGMMLGLILDKVLIHTGKETICNEKVTAAICDNRLSTKDSYHVILHTGLL
jgi:stage II sporulation protein GA (sporulation sigma-E factor processing peptidase)